MSQTVARLKEAAQLGFRRCLLPKHARRGQEPDGIEAITVRSVTEALEKALV